jgi:hypothetical protein
MVGTLYVTTNTAIQIGQSKSKNKNGYQKKHVLMNGSCDHESMWAGCQNYLAARVELFS